LGLASPASAARTMVSWHQADEHAFKVLYASADPCFETRESSRLSDDLDDTDNDPNHTSNMLQSAFTSQ
jgi:hypothetical protein